jgi:uncharacterized protein (UPF0332 family)
LAGYEPDKEPSEEAELRRAVSSVYYAVFRLTRNYLRDYYGFKVTFGTGNHSDVLQELEAIKKSQLTTVAEILRRLKKQRESADYDDVYQFGLLPKRISDILDDAERAIRLIDSLTTP